jgi:hypothetical protein
MKPLPDLSTLSREDLEALVRHLHGQLVAVVPRLQVLDQISTGGGASKGVRGTKPARQQRSKATGKPR